MEMTIPRMMIAAPASGSGKTTVFCALLGALQRQQQKAVAFKCGPDYIDPMFHRTVLQTLSHNLDMFLLGGSERTRQVLATYSRGKDLALIEGAMGYYDGIGTTSQNSAYEIAKTTQTPVIFVLNGKGAAMSLTVVLRGFQTYQAESHIAGFILNNVKSSVYAYFKKPIEEATGLRGCGYLPPLPEAALASRHLGLVTADEVPQIQEKMRLLADTAEKTLDIEAIMAVAQTARPIAVPPWEVPQGEAVTIGVAKDEAFCFYYDVALDVLRRMGAVIQFFSPLRDKQLPPCDGIYLGGGYPELHAQILSENKAMCRAIRQALQGQMPCLAECGGFMYLLESFTDGAQVYPWVGAIAGSSHMTQSLTRFGYVNVTAQEDTPFCPKGYVLPAHEFHYSDSTNNGAACMAQKPLGTRHWPCFHSEGTLWAGYPHLHLAGCPEFAWNFMEQCRAYRRQTKE